MREGILESVRAAVKMLESSPEFAALIPEVRTNIVEALADAKDPSEVVGVPGRITVVRGRAVAVAEPEFGGSAHLARLLLALMKRGAEVRAGINIRYNEEVLEVVKALCKERGLTISYVDRRREPAEVKSVEGASMGWVAEEAIRNAGGRTPHVICDLGDWGKEPLICLFSRSAIEVASLAISVAERLHRRPQGFHAGC